MKGMRKGAGHGRAALERGHEDTGGLSELGAATADCPPRVRAGRGGGGSLAGGQGRGRLGQAGAGAGAAGHPGGRSVA